jgi:hypothetical protein
MTQQSTVVLEVRVYPAGTPGQVLLEVAQHGPVYLTGPELARTLRSAAEIYDDDDGDRVPAGRHRYLASAAGTCIADAGGRACGLPPDALVHFHTSGLAVEPVENPADPADKPHRPPPHGYWPGSTTWCLYLFDGRLCGLPWDDPVHGLEGSGLREQEPPR